jgi:PncC family amidohydrolase
MSRPPEPWSQTSPRASIAGMTAIVLMLLWYGYPVWRRVNPDTSQSPQSETFNIMQQSLTGDLASAAARVLDVARKRNLTIVTAESCTAGMLSTILSQAPGASEHLHGGFVTYTKENKTKVLGVSERLLTEKSAVCPDVAMAMAEGALKRSPADLAVAVTGGGRSGAGRGWQSRWTHLYRRRTAGT